MPVFDGDPSTSLVPRFAQDDMLYRQRTTIMIRHLLFDLDGTLLMHRIGFFLQKYTMTLAIRFADLIPMEQFGKILWQSSAAMMRNPDPKFNNRDAFLVDFLARTGLSEKRAMAVFNQFYEKDFPKLQRYTRTDPKAHEVVRTAVERGFELTIATNPLFPKTAIVERMRWAGVADFSYRLITHFENMHTSKPSNEYYLEILDHLKARPEECLMIGNDSVLDMAAGQVGINTYLVTDLLEQSGPEPFAADHQGSLDELCDYIRSLP